MHDNEESTSRKGGDLARRKEPFVPDPNRIVYPIDHVTSQRAALAKFEAEIRIVVGGQLTRRMVREAGDIEDEIRERAYDAAHYTLMAAALSSFLADAIEVRHRYMNPDDEQRGQR